MPLQRIAHSKSRYGCAQCKQRRLKCDETRPCCQRCQTSSKACSFSEKTSASSPHNENSIENVEDMQLLYHFIVASKAFSLEESASEPWKDDLDPVSIAFTKHYLLHSILAISAIQIYFNDKSQTQKYQQAISHQDAAIRQARPHLIHLTKEHAEAMFWFSVYTSLFSLIEPLLRPTGPDSKSQKLDLINELVNSFQLGRGVRATLSQQDSNSKLAQIPTSGFYEDNRKELRPHLRKNYPQLDQLRGFIEATKTYSNPQEDLGDCLKAAEDLFLDIAVLQHDLTNKKNTRLIMTWTMSLTNVFLDLCKTKHPAAIGVLAFYSVALHTRQTVWFFQGWPVVLLQECERILQKSTVDYGALLEWPKQIITGP